MKPHKITKITLILTLTLSIILYHTVVFATVPRDVVIIVDNSGSMKKNDPLSLTKKAVTWFVENLPENTQIEILIFDTDVKLAAPLTLVTQATKRGILSSLKKINYRGRFTNTPAVMERAIYDLKMEGRSKSQKSIILITDGIVDTGDKARDMQRTRWLKDNLSEDAARSGIKIFGIALSRQADFELIQSLAVKTRGEYYRAFKADDIENIFSNIRGLITAVEHKDVSPTPLSPTTLKDSLTSGTVAGSQQVSAIPPAADKGRHFLMIIAVTGLLVIVLLVFVYALRSQKKRRSATKVVSGYGRAISDESMPKATLRDISGVTGQTTHDIKERITMIGRVAGNENQIINHIVINEDTISHQHAIIEYRDFSFWIIDHESTNGTFVNGQRVKRDFRLKHGDIVSFYKYEFEFLIDRIVQSSGELDKTVFAGGVDPDATIIAD